MSLRIETVGGYSDVLIAANSPVPCEKARTFLTASDNQTVVFIRVAQGESPRFAENTRLGELELSGLKPGTRGEVKILVTFELDADGILNVRAKDKDTNRETKATMRLMGTSNDAADVARHGRAPGAPQRRLTRARPALSSSLMAAPSTFVVWAESLETMNFYDILRVAPDASPKEIQKAFHALSLRCHPDRFVDEPVEVGRGRVGGLQATRRGLQRAPPSPDARTLRRGAPQSEVAGR